MMSARLALTVVMACSLLLSGGAWAHGPMPDNIDSAPYSGVDIPTPAADDTPAHADPLPSPAPTQPETGCDHHGELPTAPAIDDGGTPPTRSAPGNPHGCCTDGNCPCPPPIGKGMSIGPAHLASQGSPAPYAPVHTPATLDRSQSLLRPPIP
jgi:hypothetical protein